MVAHEYAHGWVAMKNGDPTAYQLGRLTWNPIKHIDPFMTIILPVVMLIGSHGQIALGGAKPCPVNPRNFRNYKRGDIIVSLAGVAVNAVIAVACTIAIILLGMLGRAIPAAAGTFGILQIMLDYGILFNLVLIFFNLLPIPPLDGSHVMKYLLPPAWAMQYQRIGFYGLPILIVLLTIGSPILRVWMSPMFALYGLADHAVAPYLLRLPWA